MIVSLEHLYHFNCERCNGWWSIGDYKWGEKQYIYCPHCGHQNTLPASPQNAAERDEDFQSLGNMLRQQVLRKSTLRELIEAKRLELGDEAFFQRAANLGFSQEDIERMKRGMVSLSDSVPLSMFLGIPADQIMDMSIWEQEND